MRCKRLPRSRCKCADLRGRLGERQRLVFYVLTPAVGSGAGVAYLMNRKFSNEQCAKIAKDVLVELPDPGHTVSKGGGQ
jgi:hypothetical protein